MELIYEQDENLRKVSKKVDFSALPFDPIKLTQEMYLFMLLKDGIGLAAPQIGLLYRFFIIDNDGTCMACFNPSITKTSDELVKYEEGCLSFPNLYVNIKRASEIGIKYINEHGIEQNITLSGKLARCFLHELDHLDGILLTDRAQKLSLNMAMKRRKKLLKRNR